MSLSATLIYNSASGSALSVDELRKLCAQHNIIIKRAIKIESGFERKLKAPISHGETIMAVGGDGTVSAVAGLVAHTTAVLLPIPGGTLNNFCKDLGVPSSIQEALAHAITMSPRRIDIASVNDHLFINNSSIGLYPQSLHTRKRLEDKFGKWPAAIIAVIRAFIRYRTYHVAIGKDSFRTPFIFVGNNSYSFDGPGIVSRHTLAAGNLSVYMVKDCTRWQLARLFVSAARGTLAFDNSFQHYTTTALTITSQRHSKISVSRDGELSKLSLPITYTIHKHALRILG